MAPRTSAAVLRLEAAACRRSLGLFTSTDASGLGISPAVIAHHNRPGGRWSRVLPGVYELAGLEVDGRRPLLAAQLWGGESAVLSHRAAAWILGLDGVRSARPELWTMRSRPPAQVRAHRGTVNPRDVTRTGLLRHTTALRTVLDLAGTMSDEALELVVESVIRRRPALETEISTAAAGRGCAQMRRVLRRRPFGVPATESELETRYAQLVRRTGLPTPVRQYKVDNGRRVARLDFCWPNVGLWVELDGRAWHEQPRALLEDRRRQNDLATRLQWLLLRFTWEDVVGDPDATARTTVNAYRVRGAARS